MDVRSAFLNVNLKEEVYGEQPLGFQSYEKRNNVFKLIKALYELKQAPQAWYERPSKCLLEHDFTKGNVDSSFY